MAASNRTLELTLLPESFAISRLVPDSPLPAWALKCSFFSITHSTDELSLVTEVSQVPVGVQSHKGWRILKVRGPFVLSEVGVLASLASPLADAHISVFVVSSFETDYLLVNSEQLQPAIIALHRAGHKSRR